MLNESDKNDLEQLIDTHGLSAVLQALQDICGEKAEHVQSTWQDRSLASAWRRGARLFDKLIAWSDWPL